MDRERLSCPSADGMWGRLPTPVARAVLRAVLGLFGAYVPVAARRVPRVRRQVTRTLTFAVATDDGVHRRWSFDGSRRRATSTSRIGAPPDHGLYFATSAQALATLISTRTVDRVVAGVVHERMRIEGSAFVVWFHGLTRTLVPIGRQRGPRPAPPGAYLHPDPGLDGPETIVREPAVAELDPGWTAAWHARSTLWMVRGPAGEPMPEP